MHKILHFEDEQMLADMYGAKFVMEGLDYKHYPNPTLDPVEIAISEKPDLIIMGIILPVMDGIRATKLLKADPRTKNIPVIGFDNLSQPEDFQRFRSAGMTDYWVLAQNTPIGIVHKVKQFLGIPIPYDEKSTPPPGNAWHGSSVQEQLSHAARKPSTRTSWLKRLFG